MNNYDISSSGINIETSVFYDNFLAQSNWDESFIEIKKDWIPQEYMFTAYDQLPDNRLELENLINLPDTKRNLTLLRYETVTRKGYLYYSEVRDNYTVLELLKLLLDNGDTLELLDELDLEYTLNFKTITTRGYDQGDYTNVLIPTKTLSELWGCGQDKVMEGLQETIDNLFWDMSICCRVTINEEDYYPECDGSYEYDKDEVVEELLKVVKGVDLAVLKRELEDTLPDEPRND